MTNSKATTAFLESKAQIDLMIERLSNLSGEHFNTHPDDITWGDVGELMAMAETLKEVTDRAFQEGEYAI